MDKSAPPQQVEEYLRLFHNDVDAAIRAIHNHANFQHPKKRSVSPHKTLITVDSLNKVYSTGKRSVTALHDISFNIYEGEIVALTGPSGSGKSTLLQLIGGLDRPTNGAVTIDGIDLRKMNDKMLSQFRNQTIGFVFQFFYLQPFLNVGRNIEVASMPTRTRHKDRQMRIRELASAVDLSERLDHFPSELSGGQMQRAAIARALLNRPKVILADEPTGNLDDKNSRAIIDLFEKIRQEYGTTIIIVTHDPAIASRADREIRLTSETLV